jgi:tight adherence protein C
VEEAGRPEGLGEGRLLGFTVGFGALAALWLALALLGLASLHLPLVLALVVAAPWLWLSRRARARKEAIARELPFVLDLLTLTLEAGSDLLTGIARVAERMRPGPLRDELVLSLRELRLARPKREVFGDLAARTGSPEVARMVALVLQADRMGAPVAESLRLLSGQLLVERFLLAEKKAAQAPVKILLPLAAFIFPAVFLVLFGPIALALWTG